MFSCLCHFIGKSICQQDKGKLVIKKIKKEIDNTVEYKCECFFLLFFWGGGGVVKSTCKTHGGPVLLARWYALSEPLKTLYKRTVATQTLVPNVLP